MMEPLNAPSTPVSRRRRAVTDEARAAQDRNLGAPRWEDEEIQSLQRMIDKHPELDSTKLAQKWWESTGRQRGWGGVLQRVFKMRRESRGEYQPQHRLAKPRSPREIAAMTASAQAPRPEAPRVVVPSHSATPPEPKAVRLALPASARASRPTTPPPAVEAGAPPSGGTVGRLVLPDGSVFVGTPEEVGRFYLAVTAKTGS